MLQPEEGAKIKQQVTEPEITSAVTPLSMLIFFFSQLFYLRNTGSNVPM